MAWATGTLALLMGCSGTYQAGMDPVNSAGAGGAAAGASFMSKAGNPASGGSVGDNDVPSGVAGDSSSSSSGVAGSSNSGTAGAPAFCGVALLNSPAPNFASPAVVAKRIRLFLMNGLGDSTAALPNVTTRDWAGNLAISTLDALGKDSAPGLERFTSSWLPGTPIASTWAGFFSVKGATLTDLLTTNLVRNPGSGVLTDTAVLYQEGIQRISIPARGQYLRRHLLCSEVPPPPPGVPPSPDAMAGQTRREILEQSVASPVCRTCHALMDPIGEALDHFDIVGAYSNVDNGSAIDSSGTLNLNAGTITFDGANQLGAQLAGQCEVSQCMAQQMLADAESSAALPVVDSVDAAKVAPVAAAFAASKGELRTLIRQIVQSDTFLRAP